MVVAGQGVLLGSDGRVRLSAAGWGLPTEEHPVVPQTGPTAARGQGRWGDTLLPRPTLLFCLGVMSPEWLCAVCFDALSRCWSFVVGPFTVCLHWRRRLVLLLGPNYCFLGSVAR